MKTRYANHKTIGKILLALQKAGKKLCTKCLTAKPLKEFYKESRVSCGFRPMCKLCELAYYHKKSKLYKKLETEKYKYE